MLLARAPLRTRAQPLVVPAQLWALAAIVAAKAFVFATILLNWFTRPFGGEYWRLIMHYHERDQYGLATWFTTWDSSHYLFLAEHGYQPHLHASNAFAPLLPATIAALNVVTNNSIVSGLIIANLTSVAACYLLFLFVRRHRGDATALRALGLFLAFPTAFYLNLIYTESLFILFSVASFHFLGEGQSAKAAIAAFFLPLTRWIGLLFVAPLAIAAALPTLHRRFVRGAPVAYPLAPRAIALCAGAPLLGGIVYVIAMAVLTGNPLAHVYAAQLYPSHWSLSNVVRIDLLVRNFFAGPIYIHSPLGSVFDRLFFVIFLASAPLVYRKVDKPLFVYYLSIGLVPLLGSFMSYTRYLLPAFPLYIAYADVFARHQKLFLPLLLAMLMLQYFFIGLHVRNLWVA